MLSFLMNTALIFLLFICVYLLLIWKAGKTFPIIYLFLFTYFLQYIFSTHLIYNDYDILTFQMAIKEDQYFEYANPAMFFLFAGVFLFNKDIDLKFILRRIDPQQAFRLGMLLLIVSYTFDFVSYVGFGAFNSILSFTSFLKYPAAFCFLFSGSQLRYLFIGLIYLQLLAVGLGGGMFLNIFIWSTYLFFFLCLKFQFPFWLRAMFIVVAVPVLILVQNVKDEYREATWEKGKERGFGTFTDIAQKKSTEQDQQPFAESEGVVKTVGRLTQGWHLGLTLKRVPLKVPLSNGDEMLSDIKSSILPRVLFAEKKVVGSQDKFEKYTGHKLWGTTSMTIGVLGDFYINYGRVGSFIMLFIFGALISRFVYFFIKRYVINDPINIIWIPFILSYLIRANNDFYMVFNSSVKGFLIFLAINFLRKKLWPQRQVYKLQ